MEKSECVKYNVYTKEKNIRHFQKKDQEIIRNIFRLIPKSVSSHYGFYTPIVFKFLSHLSIFQTQCANRMILKFHPYGILIKCNSFSIILTFLRESCILFLELLCVRISINYFQNESIYVRATPYVSFI